MTAASSGPGSGLTAVQQYVSLAAYGVLGAGGMLFWSVLTNSLDYFQALYSSSWVTTAVPVIYNAANLAALVVLITFRFTMSEAFQIRLGLSVYAVVLVFILGIGKSPVAGTEPAFYVTSLGVAASGAVSGMLQGALLAEVSGLPTTYAQAVLSGMAASGIALSLLRLAANNVQASLEAPIAVSAEIYFGAATLCALLCFLLHMVVLPRAGFSKVMLEANMSNVDELVMRLHADEDDLSYHADPDRVLSLAPVQSAEVPTLTFHRARSSENDRRMRNMLAEDGYEHASLTLPLLPAEKTDSAFDAGHHHPHHHHASDHDLSKDNGGAGDAASSEVTHQHAQHTSTSQPQDGERSEPAPPRTRHVRIASPAEMTLAPVAETAVLEQEDAEAGGSGAPPVGSIGSPDRASLEHGPAGASESSSCASPRALHSKDYIGSISLGKPLSSYEHSISFGVHALSNASLDKAAGTGSETSAALLQSEDGMERQEHEGPGSGTGSAGLEAHGDGPSISLQHEDPPSFSVERTESANHLPLWFEGQGGSGGTAATRTVSAPSRRTLGRQSTASLFQALGATIASADLDSKRSLLRTQTAVATRGVRFRSRDFVWHASFTPESRQASSRNLSRNATMPAALDGDADSRSASASRQSSFADGFRGSGGSLNRESSASDRTRFDNRLLLMNERQSRSAFPRITEFSDISMVAPPLMSRSGMTSGNASNAVTSIGDPGTARTTLAGMDGCSEETSGAGVELTQAALSTALRALSLELLTMLSTYLVTLALIPSWLTSDAYRYSDNMQSAVIYALTAFNLGDLVSRMFPVPTVLTARWFMVPLALSRFALIAGVVFFRDVLVPTDLCRVLLAAVLGLSNGFLTATAVLACASRLPVKYASITGTLIVLSIVCGLLCGSAAAIFIA